MNFRQCLLIAIAFHIAVMGFPIKTTINKDPHIITLIVQEIPRPETPQPPLNINTKSPLNTVTVPLPPKIRAVPEKPRIIKKKPVDETIKPVIVKNPISKPLEPIPIPQISIKSEKEHQEIVQQIQTLSCESQQRPLKLTFDSAEGPRFIRRIVPRYPAKARKLNKTGTVILELSLNDKGTLTDIVIIKKAGYGFDEEAIKAVQESVFRPAIINGKPVPCKALLPVKFELR